MVFGHEKLLNIQPSSSSVKLKFLPGYCRPNAQKKIPVGGWIFSNRIARCRDKDLGAGLNISDSEAEKRKYHPHDWNPFINEEKW